MCLTHTCLTILCLPRTCRCTPFLVSTTLLGTHLSPITIAPTLPDVHHISLPRDYTRLYHISRYTLLFMYVSVTVSNTHLSSPCLSTFGDTRFYSCMSLLQCPIHISLSRVSPTFPDTRFYSCMSLLQCPIHISLPRVSPTFPDTRFYSCMSLLQCPIHISLSRVSPTFRDKHSATCSLSRLLPHRLTYIATSHLYSPRLSIGLHCLIYMETLANTHTHTHTRTHAHTCIYNYNIYSIYINIYIYIYIYIVYI